MDGVEKVATVILAMNKDNAARILMHFEPEEVRQITHVAAQLGIVSQDSIRAIVDEFVAQFADGAGVMGSVSAIEKMLDGVLPEEQFTSIMSEINDTSARSIWARINNMSENVIANYLSKEHPQTSALILSRLKPALTAKIMQAMPFEMRDGLMRRMLTIKPIMDQAVADVENVLMEDFVANFSGSLESDTYARIASVLNKMEREQMDALLESLTRVRPKSAEMLKGLLFTFDDIISLAPRAKMEIFDQVATDQLALALKGTSATFRQSILSTLSSRARRMIEQELDLEIPALQRDVMNARRAITDLAMEMANRGEIELNPAQDAGSFLK